MIVVFTRGPNVPLPLVGSAPPIASGTVGAEAVHPIALRRERLRRQREAARRGAP